MSADVVNDVVAQFLDRTTSDTEAIAFRVFPQRPSGPIEEWWQQGRGPEDDYLVSISKRAVRISGRNDYYEAQFARTFDPTLTAIETSKGPRSASSTSISPPAGIASWERSRKRRRTSPPRALRTPGEA